MMMSCGTIQNEYVIRYLICLFCYIDETTLMGRVNLTFEFTLHRNDILVLYISYTHFQLNRQTTCVF